MSVPFPIPDGPQEIERGWLEEVLRAFSDESLTLEQFEWELIGPGKGFVGQLARLRLQGRGLPMAIIAKFPSADPQLRALCQRYRLFEREVRFYREMAASTTLRTPLVYCAEGDDESGVLLLEDLTARGMVAADNDRGANAAQAAATLCHLARAQADCWGPPPGRLPFWLPRFDAQADENQQTFQKLWQPFLGKNVLLEEKVEELERSISERQALKGQLNLISEREAERWGLEGFVGKSPTIRRIFEEIRLVQESATTSVLIEGESGTGKELIARAIHFGGPRSQGPFVPVNCAAFPGELVESLLFGHRKGAFTGAHEDRIGFFEMADQGTLFLDEIGEMPLELQSKLLRVLEDGKVQRVGEQQERQVDVRVVAATNVDVQQLIGQNQFRQDLYFRLARFVVTAPPLRERGEDIPLLAQHFMLLFAREMGRDTASLSAEAHAALCAYAFPGNVRELKNIIERALIESRGLEIEAHHLHFLAAKQAPASDGEVAPIEQQLPENLDDAVEQTERYLVKRALDRTAGNIAETARLLGTNRNRIYRVLGQDRGAD